MTVESKTTRVQMNECSQNSSWLNAISTALCAGVGAACIEGSLGMIELAIFVILTFTALARGTNNPAPIRGSYAVANRGTNKRISTKPRGSSGRAAGRGLRLSARLFIAQ